MQHSQSKFASNGRLLKATVSAGALSVAMMAASTGQVRAQSICSTFTPMTGETVTCTFDTDPGTNDALPITTAISGATATGVTLDIEDTVVRPIANQVGVIRASVPVISLGAGASIDIQSADVGNVDLSGDFVDFDAALRIEGFTSISDLAAYLTDEGIPATVGVDMDGDEFINLADPNDALRASVAFSDLFTDADGAVIELGAPSSIDDIDPATLTAIATSPGLNSAAGDANGNFLNLGRLAGVEANVYGVGSSAIRQASGGAASIQLLNSDVSSFASNGAAILLDASDGRGGAIEVSLSPGTAINSAGTNAPALLGVGDGVIIGLASSLGEVITTGNFSPLVEVEGDNSIIHVRLSESDDQDADFDFAPYVTLGDDSSLFKISGDNNRAFFTSNQVGVRNDNGGMQTFGANSHIIDYDVGEAGFVNVDFLNSNASTFGDGARIFNLSMGSTSTADVLFGNATLETQGANSTAILVGDTTDSSISTVILTANQFTTSGAGSLGVDVGSVSMTGSLTAQMNGGTIATSGVNAHGARFAANGASDSAVATIDLQDAIITTSGADAFGLIVGATATGGSAADVDIDDLSITTGGMRADGLQASLGANISSAASFTIGSTMISTSGDLSDGAVFTSAVSTTVDAGSTLNGVVDTTVITTSGRFADALVIGENVTVYGPSATSPTDGAAKLRVDTFEDFSATGLGGRGIHNNGVIEVAGSGITYSAGKTGRVANGGTLTGEDGVAVTFAGDTDDIFELQPTAITTGTVDGAGGTDTFILGGEGTDTFDTDLLDTQYVNFENFEKEDLSAWTITSDDTRSWTVRGGDLIVGTGTNLTNDGTATVLVTEGLSAANVDGTEQIIKTRGQLIIEDGAAVNSANVDVAAIQVDGNIITEDLPQVDIMPPEDITLEFRQRTFEPTQTFADVRVSGIIDTTANGAVGVQALATGDATPLATVSLEGSGRIQTLGADSSAIAGAATGSNMLTVYADENSSIRTSGARSSAVFAEAGNNSVEVVLLDNVSISTFGDDSAAIANLGDNGILSVTADGSIAMSTIGDNADAIVANGDSTILGVTFTQDVSLTTAGDNAVAVRGPGNNSILTLTASGTSRLATQGNGSSVVQVDDFDTSIAIIGLDLAADRTQQTLLSEGTESDLVSVSASGAGQSTFVFTAEGADSAYAGADFETLGDGSNLMRVNAGPSGSVTASFEDVNAITRGAGASGYQLATGAEGDLTVLVSGGTVATLGNSADAIDLGAGANAALDFALNGTQITTAGTDAVGVKILGSIGGTNDVDIGGSVATIGARSHAVWLDRQAENFALTGALSSTGDNAKGIGADGSTFVIALGADSTITTTGADSDGVWIAAEAQVPIDSATVTADGAISTQGDDASGIWVSTLAGDSFDDGIADTADDRLPGAADITLSGTIETAGQDAYGIGAEGTGMTITVAQAGSISTTGVDGDGIWLDYGDEGTLGGFEDGTITMNGDILTTGDNAEGIWVDRSGLTSGGTTITVGGDIRTEGAESHGISVFYGAQAPMTAGNAGTITVSGDIDARGAGSDGIRTYLDNGASTNITIQAGGDVFAPGDGDNSIYLTSFSGASGIATANITVEAASETASRGNVYASSGFAIAEGNDSATPLVINTTLNIAGNVSAGGNDITSIDLSTGDDVINVTEDGFIGGTVLLGEGDDVMTLAGTLRSLSETALFAGTGDDEIVVLPTATILGEIDMGPGDDTVAFDGAEGTTGNVSLLADDVVFAIDVERIEKRGAGTWVFEGDNIPAGTVIAPAFLLEGTSRVQAQYLSVDTTVSAPARLEGNGGVGNLLNAGTLAPGVDGVGTFTVAGGLTLEPTSMLEIDIAADGTSDLIAVGLDVVLDGALAVNGVMYPTGFPNEEDYVIITAEADIFGEFSSVTDNLPDVDVTVAYNDNDVTISYDKGQDLSDKSIQANTVQSALIDGRLFAETLRRRGVLMGAAGGFASAGNVQLAQNGAPTDIANGGRKYAVWAAAMGAIAEVDSTGAQTGYDVGMGGIASGFDGFVPLDDGMVRLGVAFGYSMGDIDNASSGADVNTWHLGAHAVYEKDKFGISGALSYGFQSYKIERVIELTGAPAVVTQGDANGNVFSASVGAKYTVYESDTFSVSPIAHIEHVSAKRGAYTETGAGILNLAVDAERFDRTFIGGGVRLEAESEGAGGIVYKPQLDLMYEHAFGDRTAVVNSTAANLQNIDFTTRGGQEARSQVAVGAGMAMQISDRVSAHVRYDGSYASNFISHRGSAGLSFSF